MKSRPILLASLLCLAACPTYAANWPAFRGPTGNGVSPELNLPLRWSATENVRWKTPLPDRGNGSPIVWGDRVFITQAVEGRRLVMCFDRQQGKLLWQSGPSYGETEETHGTNPYCSPTPVTDGERVIAWFGSAGIYCFDFNGRELWHRDLGKQKHTWGFASSPVLHGDMCLLNFGPGKRSFLTALDKKTGQTLWQVDIPEVEAPVRTDGFRGNEKDGRIGSFSTPLLITTGGREELVVSYPEQLRAFEPKTGREIWRCGGLNPLIYTSPTYGEGVIVAMGGFNGTTIAVKDGGNGDVTATHRLWQTSGTKNRCGSAVIHQGHFYVLNMDGMAECIKLQTGERVWQERLKGAGPKSDSWSSMLLVGDLIYVLNQSGDTTILKASPKFEVVGVNALGNEPCNATHAFSNGDIFIRTDKNLWCIRETKTAAR